jgi:hypothetical protein
LRLTFGHGRDAAVVSAPRREVVNDVNYSVSGWRNPMASQFKTARDAFFQKTAPSELGYYLDDHPPDPAKLSALLKGDAFQDTLASCSIEPEFVELLIFSLRKHNPGLSRQAAVRAISQHILQQTTLATLYDRAPSFSLEPGKLVLDSGVTYRYVTASVEFGDQIQFGKCLQGPDVRHLDALDSIANARVEDIVAAFPSIRNVKEFASIAAFLRWARVPGHLQAVDFYSLLAIPGHDKSETPTPDMIVRRR